MPFIPANTNTGTLNKENTGLHNRLHDTLTEIINKHSQIDALTIQETNCYDVTIQPFFENLPHTNHTSRIEKKRGVATYATTEPTPISLPNTQSEIVTTIHIASNKGRGGRKKDTKFAVINCYNNFHIETDKLLEDIDKYIKHLEYVHRIQQIVIIGDFNEDRIIIPGYAELRHQEWYHKHHEDSVKHTIDKCFANFNKIRILEVHNSVEATAITDPDCGHKVVVLILFDPPPVVERSVLSYKKVIKLLADKTYLQTIKDTDFNWKNIETAVTNGDLTTAAQLIDQASNTLTTITADIVQRCTIKTTVKANIHYKIEQATDLIQSNEKNQNELKKFYQFFRNLKNGLERSPDTLPPLQEFAKPLEAKLASLNEPHQATTEHYIEFIYAKHPFAEQIGLTPPENSLIRFNTLGYYHNEATIVDPPIARLTNTPPTQHTNDNSAAPGPNPPTCPLVPVN